jgi:NAD(P)-dependent dehydrogenase (short-subunit alcohol dehydrogenase family)
MSEHESVVHDYLRTMRESMAQMSKVVSDYLGVDVSEIAWEPQSFTVNEAQKPEGLSPPEPASERVMPTLPGYPTFAVPVQPAVQLHEMLLQIVSERTGYPIEMLGLELDLEADLSIDSIKRVEIIGMLTLKLGITAERALEELPEDLVRLKTLRGIVDALTQWMDGQEGMITGEVPELPPVELPTLDAAPAGAVASSQASEAVTAPIVRYVPAWSPTAQLRLPRGALTGLGVAIASSTSAPTKVVKSRLVAAGATVTNERTGADIFLDLRPLSPRWTPGQVPAIFEDLKSVLAGEVKTICLVTGLGDLLKGDSKAGATPPGAGIAGLVKSLAKERSDCNFRILNLPASLAAAEASELICRELATIDDVVEVTHSGGSRYLGRVLRRDLFIGSEPAIELDRYSRVLITGGARGITAQVAIGLARRFRCHLDLVGRTKPVDPEQFSYVDESAEPPVIRQQLIAGGLRDRAEIEAVCSAIIKSREIAETLRAIRAAGGTADYHVVDVRDGGQFGELIDDLYDKHGRIDGVIHGAGVIEDALAGDKSVASFRRVFETKVNGGLTLASKLRDDVVFIVFFGSVSGVFGNMGQTDYASANDFLDKLALGLNAHRSGRVVSIDWGPWFGGGMISPELAREYARRGYSLLQAGDGVQRLIDELLYGRKDDAQVVLTATDLTRMA